MVAMRSGVYKTRQRTPMARLLFVQPSLQPPGGGNGVAAWMLQTLSENHHVTVLTWRPWDPAALDAFFGTTLAGRAIDHHMVTGWWRRLLDAVPIPLHLLRNALLLRSARRRAADADLTVSANNESPLGSTGVDYVHYPTRARPRPAADMRWYHWAGPLAFYYALGDRVAGFGAADVRRQVLLANSRWTAERLRQLYGVQAHTVYPPVAGPFVARPWAMRDDVVLSIGRFAPEKNLVAVIAIVEALRRRGHTLTLTIVGGPTLPSYERRIRALAASRPWVTIREGLDRAALLDLMSRCRYGLHGMVDEHFGMAPAELVEAGCLTFVHRSGGQTEIVESDDLTYLDVDDAVRRIERALVDGAHRQRLSDHLAARRGRFDTTRFCAQVLAIVDETLERGTSPASPATAPTRPRRRRPAARS
jgi:glycosyltransferase involved in cell wall biosynthesis